MHHTPHIARRRDATIGTALAASVLAPRRRKSPEPDVYINSGSAGRRTRAGANPRRISHRLGRIIRLYVDIPVNY
jgi:hypothetical protein